MFGQEFAANIISIELVDKTRHTNGSLSEIAWHGGLNRLGCFERLKSLAVPISTEGTDLEPLGRLRTLEELDLHGISSSPIPPCSRSVAWAVPGDST